MENRVNQLMKSKLVPAVLSIVLGIVIIIARRAAVDLLVKIIGGLVIASGLFFILTYLMQKEKTPGSLEMVLTMAGISVLIGILLISFAENIVDIFPTIMGIFLILNGLSHLTVAYANPENRILLMFMGVLVIVLGVLIVLRPGSLVNITMIFIGASFIVNGLMDLLMLKKTKDTIIIQ